MKDTYIGLDIGASSLKLGCGSISDGLALFYTVENDAGNEALTNQLLKKAVNIILDELPQGHQLQAIGIGTPGIIDKRRGEIIANCPNMTYWVGAKPQKYLQETFSVPVIIENDADLMTYGEANVSPTKERLYSRLSKGSSACPERRSRNLLGITIGSGIGSGFVLNGAIYHINDCSALELGHTIIVPRGRYCSCGKQGCLEAYSSANSILVQIEEQTGEKISLERALKKCNYHQLTAPDNDCFLAAEERHNFKDEIGIITSVFKSAYDKLALSIANAVMVTGAETVVIGGGISESENFRLEPISRGVESYLTEVFLENFMLRNAYLKNKAAVWGGIVLAERCCQYR